MPASPGITITTHGMSNEYARGTTDVPRSLGYAVVVYIYVPTIAGAPYAEGWWGPKPYWDTPFSPIGDDGSWSCLINTGAYDMSATEIVAYVVPTTSSPPIAAGSNAYDIGQQYGHDKIPTPPGMVASAHVNR